MAARRLSLSFDSPGRAYPRTSAYRQIHLNGLLQIEGDDYEWRSGNLLVFGLDLSPVDILVVGVAGYRPHRVPFETNVPSGVPFGLDGALGIVVDEGYRVRQTGVGVGGDVPLRPRISLYDHLLLEE